MPVPTRHRADTEALPAVSAELVLFRVHVECLLTVLGRRKAEKYLKTACEIFATEESLAEITPFRPVAVWPQLTEARRGAAFWFRQALPTFMARVPKE